MLAPGRELAKIAEVVATSGGAEILFVMQVAYVGCKRRLACVRQGWLGGSFHKANLIR